MKKILVLILTITLTYGSFAQLKGKLSFFSQEGDKFWVILNGEKINKEPAYSVKDINVSFDYGSVRIIFENSKIPSIDKAVQVVDVENNLCHVLYMIKKDKKGKYVIRDIDATWEVLGPKGGVVTTTTTTVPANSNVTTSTTVNQPAQSNQNTQTVNQTTTTSTNTGNQQEMNMGFGINVTETPDGVDMNVNMGGVNVNTSASGNNNGLNSSTNMNVPGGAVTTTSSTTTTTTTTTTSTSGNVSNNANTQSQSNNLTNPKPVEHNHQPKYVLPGYSGPTGCAMPMTNESFNTAKSSISGKTFEDSKMTIAKQVVGNNCLLCSQVKEIMALFTFEDTKLEFAKFAYKHTFDIGNYYQLNDAFKFESTIEELNEYITNNK